MLGIFYILSSVQFSPTLCDPMNHSTPGLPVHHHLPEFTHTHWVSNLGAPGEVSCHVARPLTAWRPEVAGRSPRGSGPWVWVFQLRPKVHWRITPTVAFSLLRLIRCWSLRFSPYSKRGDMDLSSPFTCRRILAHILQSSHNFSFWKLCFPMPTVVWALWVPLSLHLL